jgi:hypothetical protein
MLVKKEFGGRSSFIGNESALRHLLHILSVNGLVAETFQLMLG